MDRNLQGIIAAMASFIAVSMIVTLTFLFCKTFNKAERSDRRPRATAFGESATYESSPEISMAELVRATANFSSERVVGDGSFGLVYKARLSNGAVVAVKKLSRDAFQGFREFRAEMDTLAKLRHEHLVRILGYCASGSERVLVYEFMEAGSLDEWLHEEEKCPLKWRTRMKIVNGVADGLRYLHTLRAPVIHRDIKSSNVLLDQDFEAHIADFGLARMVDSLRSCVSTQAAGTMGYMPPEYKEGVTGASMKADVYSFGTLMMEVATGHRPNWPVKDGAVELGLVEWVGKGVLQNREMDMVDSRVDRRQLINVEVVDFFRIACVCTHDLPRGRPTMADVVGMLDGIGMSKIQMLSNS